MYVAFRWLWGLCFAMWLGLCCLDMYLTQYKTSIYLSTAITPYKVYKYSNESLLKDVKMEKITQNWHLRKKKKHHRIAYLHYVTFLAGAIALFVYNKRALLATYCRSKIIIPLHFFELQNCLKIIADYVSVAMLKLWRFLKEKLQNYPCIIEQSENGQNTNLSLLKRMKDLVRDRKAIGQILMAAIEENKNIRRQCQLEIIAKNRLLRYVKDTQNVMKENKSRYVDFQQLYMTTSKENCLMKMTIKKLQKEKMEAEKNLLELINIVYRSRNNDLKAYCTRFIVHTKKNLLNSDVGAEIHKFLQKSKPVITVVDEKLHFSNNDLLTPRVTEIMDDDDNFASYGSTGPKLRGLPGEYVWTAKNKDGIIEKLYEYECGAHSDNGETIRRIREYSVFHDKDSLVDQTSLAASIPTFPSLSASATRLRLDIKSFSSQGFLTKILLKSVPLQLPPSAETPPLPYMASVCDS
ncbi:uncharacterized protein LOC125228414 isoform X1 [Leguminivora glycinivorella]|uniref:uncharacterized protein LOC125228414 isoform X1 n=1 Tax=Leguminivora glycinivorella TaxID=1035111 RepID=UPI00200D1996|nr:uncharacterized protein LOC125228414 isoform X1 [Leguminivora glycinivorella]